METKHIIKQSFIVIGVPIVIIFFYFYTKLELFFWSFLIPYWIALFFVDKNKSLANRFNNQVGKILTDIIKSDISITNKKDLLSDIFNDYDQSLRSDLLKHDIETFVRVFNIIPSRLEYKNGVLDNFQLRHGIEDLLLSYASFKPKEILLLLQSNPSFVEKFSENKNDFLDKLILSIKKHIDED